MPVPPDLFPIATDARLAGDNVRTRLIVDLSRTIEVAAFTLADPYRVILDLPQVTFQLRRSRRERARPDQGVPLRARDAGRLAHRGATRPDR